MVGIAEPETRDIGRIERMQQVARIGYATGAAALGGLEFQAESRVIRLSESLLGIHGNGLESLNTWQEIGVRIVSAAAGAVIGYAGVRHYQQRHQG